MEITNHLAKLSSTNRTGAPLKAAVCPFAHAQAALPQDGLSQGRPFEGVNAIEQLKAYAGERVELEAMVVPVNLPEPATAAPDPAGFAPKSEIEAIMAYAATGVKERVLTGAAAENFDTDVRKEITALQKRQTQVDGGECMSRLVHRRQLHGGLAEVHWSPAANQMFEFFDMEKSTALVRFSDASNEADPDGKSMFGMALSVFGQDGKATDILLTGGSERTEASQAEDAEAQMALFNMINAPSKLKGIGRILKDAGPISGPRMLADVVRMRTDLPSLSNLTAWSRAPFALKGKDGHEYLVKMRAVPSAMPEGDFKGEGETTSDRLVDGFQKLLKSGEARYGLEFQFMRPGDDPYDGRATWDGPWLRVGEVALPKNSDQAQADAMALKADSTKFSVWKNKQPHDEARDKDVLRPWGETNRARLAAYNTSGANRSCPYLAAQGDGSGNSAAKQVISENHPTF